jgi:hypothetical protein
MKKGIVAALLLIPFLANTQIKIVVTLSSTPSWTTKLIPCNLKYNKQGHFDFTQDDRGKGALDAAAYWTRGIAPSNGVAYLGLSFSDGANTRPKNIFYTGSVATNAFANGDTLSDYSALGPTYMNWKDMHTIVQKGWSILDHGAFHGVDQPGAIALGLNPLKNSVLNRNYTYRKLAAFGDEYVMRFGVVPSGDIGYHSAWEQLGYIGGTSQNTFDGYPADPSADWANNGLATVTNLKNDNRYHVRARRFKDMNAADAVSEYKSYIDNLISACTPTANFSLSYFIHQWDFANFKTISDYLHTKANDRIWVCGLQEFYEYFQTIQQTAITQKISGDTLTVVLDQSFLPDDLRWRDMSFLLNSNVEIKNVVVTGADDYSYNTNTGLINIYKKKIHGYPIPKNYNATVFLFNKKIPLELNDFYIDNNYDNKPAELIDDNIKTQFHAKQYDATMIYSPYDVVVDLSDYGAVVNKVRVYVAAGGNYKTMVLLARNDNEEEVPIGNFSGSNTNRWIEFTTNENKFVASKIIFRSNSTGGYGNELEVYADYLPYKEQTYEHRHAPLGDMLGTNAHWWNFVRNAVGPLDALEMNKIRAFDSLHLRSLRNYGNAQEYTAQNGSVWAFNPVVQGWFEDLMMYQLKKDNPDLIRWSVLQGQFHHVADTWNVPDTNWQMKGKVVNYVDHGGWGTLTISVSSARGKGIMTHWFVDPLSGKGTPQISNDWHDIPEKFPANKSFNLAAGVPYATGDIILARGRHTSQLNYNYKNNSNVGRSTPATWDTIARLAYRWAARKGKNIYAEKSSPYLSPYPGMDNNDRVGLGTSEWTEIMNEPNAWWAGYDDYLNGQHLALAWSKIYDNNKVYSTSLGAKNADPGMIVSTSGLAISTTDQNRSAEFWAKKNRGSRPKTNVPTQPDYWRAKTFGWTDNPFDVIQFHNYSYTGGSNQFAGGVNAGLPPELSNCLQAVDEFVWFRNKYAPWAKVDVGEWGYDVNQKSPMNAPPIGKYDAEQVRGAWAIRTMLEYNVHGVDYAQWYRLYQDRDDDNDATQFATMSLLKNNKDGAISRRIVGNYFRQFSEFGDYVFDKTIKSDSLRVQCFKNKNSYLYAIWSVEKMKTYKERRPEFTNRTGIYNLQLPLNSSIQIKRFQDNAIVMSSEDVLVKANSYSVKYDLNPVFIVVKNIAGK